ncbi:enterotoxin [Trinickia terrae]|uniref:Enterotoxin n=1 Tax=Trinickia terrae TaxID=2571161 RepID=A0A4U1IG30_9BURK|nr:enterotoxin [Trinickia terrae]TKC92723.1 enterotoxin [Trinickia terrae]
MPELQTSDGGRCSFGNAAIALTWALEDGRLGAFAVVDRAHGRTLAVSEPFALTFADGRTLGVAGLTLLAPLRDEALAADPRAARLAERIAGRRVSALLRDEEGRLRVEWSIEQREGSPYLRERVAITALVRDEPIVAVSMLRTEAAGARKTSALPGTPVVTATEDLYLGFELPMSVSEARDGMVRFTVARALPLEKGKTLAYSAVAGVARQGQLRRDFSAYLERERAHPYRPFLHYNSWYDIGYLTRYTEAQALERIDTLGRELHDKRGVQIDSFLFDDGWDDYSGSWRFSEHFPRGFAPLREAAARYGAAPGVWLSPWGGYCGPREERVARGRAAGYETVDDGLALSGPNYYGRFHDVVMDLLSVHGVNQFKFDGTGNANRVFPRSAYNSDWDAAIELIDDIRRAKPETFINLSTGTLPSPFWLRYADTIWRGGVDDGLAGVGSNRERWITYRDAQTYRNVVRESPLFPLNSLMLHGIIRARENPRLSDSSGDDFVHEVRSYFGSGTQLQELYVTPSLLGARDWDVLAESAKWARANASVLRDSHWIGGAPDALDIYGWAAWSPEKAIVTLRNPANREQRFDLDLRRSLELPAGFDKRFRAHCPWQEQAVNVPGVLDADQPQTVPLAPFEVLTLELLPVPGMED